MPAAIKEVLLNGTWDLHDEPIYTAPEEHTRVVDLPASEWLPTPVPGDIRQGLIAAGRMNEPLVGLNSYDGHWVEERSWWFRKRFTLSKAILASPVVELEMHRLDVGASVFLNGVHIGSHPSAFRPFVANVKDALRPGENVLLVRLTHGVEDVTEEEVKDMKGWLPTEAERGRPERGEPRRIFVRKPQFTWGWDWSPRCATIAMAGDVVLRGLSVVTIRDVQVRPHRRPNKTDVDLAITVKAHWLDVFQFGYGKVTVQVRDPRGKVVAKADMPRAQLQSGDNYLEFSLPIRNAKWWWPTGMGAQDRYTIEARIDAPGITAEYPAFKYGIRFIELQVEPKFAIFVNGVRAFCKGANYIPPDAIYARTTQGQVEEVVLEAKRANFNMLRIWGGAWYERDSFYETCDREGMMIFHDFMFACSPYPDHLESFRDEVAKEADYQTRRLRNRASIVLWAGCNECLYTCKIGKPDETTRITKILGHVLPQAVHRNCPEIPYWYCSPNYPTEFPASWLDTDCHYWALMMNSDMAKRIDPTLYDQCPSPFNSEFGYPGPCVKETTLHYLAGAPFDRADKTWQHHNNTFEKDTVDAGISKHYRDARTLSIDQYLLYGGLTQGMMLGYAGEAMRFNDGNGNLFWMFNDCWAEVGWSVFDGCQRRKISWYFVRRAYADRKLMLRPKGNKVVVRLANDTPAKLTGTIEFGWVSLDGKKKSVKRRKVKAAPFTRPIIATLPRGKVSAFESVWFARMLGKSPVEPGILHAADFRALRTRPPHLKHAVKGAGKGAYHVTVSSDVFAHAVHLDLPAGALPDDDYFDLLPGESRTLIVTCPHKLTTKNITATSVTN